MNPAATSISATAAAATCSYLVIENEPRGQRGEHDEQYVQVEKKAIGRIGGAATAHRRLHRLAADHHERYPQRQRQQRQEQLPRADPGDHGREQAPEHGHTNRREEDSGDLIESQRHSEEQRERGQQNRLADDQQERRRQRLAREDRGGRGGRHQHRLERSLLALGRKRPAEGNEAREHQGHPQDAGRDRRRVVRVEMESEVRDYERKHDELRQGRHDLAGPPLGGQVLARDSQRDGYRPHY